MQEEQQRALTFLDLFSGCGGASCGFRAAGWTPLGAVDVDEAALRTYRANFEGAEVVCGDVRDEALRARLVEAFRGRVDAVVGGPPCQGFSSRNTHKEQPRYEAMNALPMSFVELALALEPRAVLIEEVPKARVVVPAVRARFEEAGYAVWHGEVDASAHGVPQRRKRLLLVATKGNDFAPPAPTLPAPSAGEALRRAPVPAAGPPVAERVRAKIVQYGEKGLRAGQYAVMDLSKPARTIHTQTLNSTGPYTLKRGDVYHVMSVEETARLQSFPPAFAFVGCATGVRKQIGNAVPPELARRFALQLAEAVLGVRPL